jgi:glycosyltransferase involved in cell wall biosynthesis
MPNVVLEMIAQGLPVVCTDVGGLRETFTDESIWFIKINERNIDEVAKSFQQTLIEIHNNSAELLESKLTAAFNAIEHIHAPSNFDKSISKLLKQKRHF